ncbi:MAG: helix-turn-helix transcriptional regulator [Clostridia bacterium]|nr:helix-turn-helix transcriptional regulator [Clostridia bacterium]
MNVRSDRPRWAIILKYEGETEYFSDGKIYRSNIDNIAILPKGSSYNWRCTEEGHYSVVEFDGELTYDKILTVPIKNGEKLLDDMKKMELKSAYKSDFYEIETLKDVYSLLFSIIQSAPRRYTPTEKQKKIAPVLDYIAKNYDKKIKNEELARLTGYSTVYFRQLFTEVIGRSPIDYIQSVRIAKAKEMLKSDHTGITDIALSLGYQSIYDFSRAFKKHTGVPPTKY